LTEFFTAATVPNGYYTKATMEPDYSTANIEVENASGYRINTGETPRTGRRYALPPVAS